MFNNVIETSEKNPDLQERLQILYREITLSIYTNVSRGLFERHKLVYSFMLCVAILMQRGDVTDSHFNYLLRGPVGAKQAPTKKPDFPTLTDAMWIGVNYLAANYEEFRDLPADTLNNIELRIGDFQHVISLSEI